MKIKVTKDLTLLEFLQKLDMGEVLAGEYKSEKGKNIELYIYDDASFRLGSKNTIFPRFHLSDIYEVEVEEEVTEDTRFHDAQLLYIDKHTSDLCIKCFAGSWSIQEMLSDFNGYDFLQIHPLIDGKRQLVWERGDE